MTWCTVIPLPDSHATNALAARIAPHLKAGDCLLLAGDIGAGKSTFARAALSSRLQALDRLEDIPSPTFTLVQIYDLDTVDAWHFDLYRLNDPAEALELGLDDALDSAICLIEWPERLGHLRPATALTLAFAPTPEDGRMLTVSTDRPERWSAVLSALNCEEVRP